MGPVVDGQAGAAGSGMFRDLRTFKFSSITEEPDGEDKESASDAPGAPPRAASREPSELSMASFAGHQTDDSDSDEGGGGSKTFLFSYGEFDASVNELEVDPMVLRALAHTPLECDDPSGLRFLEGAPSSRSSGFAGSMRSSVSSSSSRRGERRSLRRSAFSASDYEVYSNDLDHIGLETNRKDWLRSFRDLDPRRQILTFFNELSLEGVEKFESRGCAPRRREWGSILKPIMLRGFIKHGIFSVWRPTSDDAIRKMMMGEGMGKGLDIKGKSAKCGVFAGYVPFLQISKNKHKIKVGATSARHRVRVFYPNKLSRSIALAVLNLVGKCMAERLEKAESILMELEMSKKCRRSMMLFMKNMGSVLSESQRFEMIDPNVYIIDDYALTQGVYGLDIPEKIFWEVYVNVADIDCIEGSKYDSGRPSMPEFQHMNIETLRGKDIDCIRGDDPCGSEAVPRPVLWHGECRRVGGEMPEDCNPLSPMGLLMAYEENGKVTPVVSDFDCFLLGTRGVRYDEPLGGEELCMLSTCVEHIECILSSPREGCGWTQRWLELKKKNYKDKCSKVMPRFGYADPRSYRMMTGAVHHLKSNGAVRHGPECFNYGFPQEIDDQFLVISDTFPGVPWRRANPKELIDILCEKVDEGFTFPLNPKWILCDPGWRKVYEKLLTSNEKNVEDSMNIWYPYEVRRKILEVSDKFPDGFVGSSKDTCVHTSGVQTDLARLELRRYEILMEGKEKFQDVEVRQRSARKIWQSARALKFWDKEIETIDESDRSTDGESL